MHDLRKGMFSYSDITLHTPLSVHVSQGDAIMVSTLILGFMGTRHPKKGTLIAELQEQLVLQYQQEWEHQQQLQ